jgi:hypothetical protein
MANYVNPPEKSVSPTNSFHDSGAAKTLTGSWVTGTGVDVRGHASAVVDIQYEDGTETLAQVRLMASVDGGTSYRPYGLLDTHSSGQTAAFKHVISLAPANFDNASGGILDGVVVTVAVTGITHIRADAKADTPGGSAGSVLVRISGGYSV